MELNHRLLHVTQVSLPLDHGVGLRPELRDESPEVPLRKSSGL